jgi:hypothetical protein
VATTPGGFRQLAEPVPEAPVRAVTRATLTPAPGRSTMASPVHRRPAPGTDRAGGSDRPRGAP